MSSDEAVHHPSSFMGNAEIADPTYEYLLQHLPSPRGSLLDLGSGRGRFLTKAREAGYATLGVDSDPWSVEQARISGLDVHCADLWNFLDEQTSETFDVISAIHLVEHFSPDSAQRLIDEAARLLKAGGTLALVTPNFADWRVASETFWLDPTHVRPYPLMLLSQMGSRARLNTQHAATEVLVQMGKRRLAARPFQRLRFGSQYDRMNAVILLTKPSAD